MSRAPALLVLTALCYAQDQKPRWQPAWPCTGKEPSFDPVYARIAEASGGQVFLLDRSEAGRSMTIDKYDSNHRATIARAAGKLESPYEDFRVPVDSTIDSLLVSVTLQCMQAITIYDPHSAPVKPAEDNLFRAGRIAMIPKPEPGVWTIRLQGAGPYFLSVQARTAFALHSTDFAQFPPKFGADQTLTVTVNAPTRDVRFRLVGPAGEPLQTLVLSASEDRPDHFSGTFIPGFKQFRVLAEGADERGFPFQRIDPHLFEAKSTVP